MNHLTNMFTGIIHKEYQTGQPAFWLYYIRKAKKIIKSAEIIDISAKNGTTIRNGRIGFWWCLRVQQTSLLMFSWHGEAFWHSGLTRYDTLTIETRGIRRMLNQFNITAKEFNKEISQHKTISKEPLRYKLDIE